MPKLDVVADDDLNQFFSAEVCQEMRDSIYSGGDCRACSRPLIDGQKVRLEAVSMPGSWMVWARHATCAPTVEDGNHTAFFTPLTWTTMSAALPTNDGTSPGKSSFFRKPAAPELMPIVILNPSIDGFSGTSPLGSVDPDQSLLGDYLQVGFDEPGKTPLGGAQAHSFTCRITGNSIGFNLMPFGGSYDADLHPVQGADSVRKKGGVLLILTHAVTAHDVTDARSIEQLMRQPHRYVTAWLPLEN